jgi:protein-S-isoprenylcysteine O-methyltransferase Ste14
LAPLGSQGIGAEEQMTLETFGDEYSAYMARTKRLVPRVW